MSTIKGFIDDGIGNISEITLRTPQNPDTAKLSEGLEELKQVHVLNNRYKANDKMIIGRMWHSKYPVGYTRFLDDLKHIPTKIEPTFGKTAFLNWKNDENIKIKYDPENGLLYDGVTDGEKTTIKDGEIVLCRGNFQIDHQTESPIIISETIYLIDANLFLNGCQLWFTKDAKLVCSGNTNVFGGTIRYFNLEYAGNIGFIELMNYDATIKSSFNFVGLGLTIEFTGDKYKNVNDEFEQITNNLVIYHSIFDCYADYSKIVIDHCNIVLQCDENDIVTSSATVASSVRTLSLFYDGNKINPTDTNLVKERFSYYIELKNSYIYGQYWHANLIQGTDKENYGISLIYAYGNVAIQNCTFDLDGVDSVINVRESEFRKQTNWKVPNHRFVKITDSKFNILDMTKLFIPAHDLFVLENTSINVGTVRNLNAGSDGSIKNHVPCLIELNKDPYITSNLKQEHIILKDVELGGTIQTADINNHSNGFIIRNRILCNKTGGGDTDPVCNIKIIYNNDKILRVGSNDSEERVEIAESIDSDGSTWYIEKDPVESAKKNTNVLTIKTIKYVTGPTAKFVIE